MPTTSNFGWTTPADTDLVKDGAAAIRTLGNGIDTSFLDLKGGTTGQVLAKASNTDLDFTWSAADPLSILDAKGDLISATAADTPARLAVGANDTVLTADSSTSTGLKWAAPASGGMTLISTTTLSGSSTSLTSIPGTYVNLALYIVNYYSSSAARIDIRVNSTTPGYLGATQYNDAGTINSDTTITASFRIHNANTYGTTDLENFSFLEFPLYANATGQRLGIAYSAYKRSSDNAQVIERTMSNLAIDAEITSIDIRSSAGTFSGGTAYLYGVK